MLRVCPNCKRAFVLLKTDPPNQQLCNSCRFHIPVPKREKP